MGYCGRKNVQIDVLVRNTDPACGGHNRLWGSGAGRGRLERWVVASPSENPVRVFWILGAVGEADVDLAEGTITASVSTLVAECIALFQPRDDGGHGLLHRRTAKTGEK